MGIRSFLRAKLYRGAAPVHGRDRHPYELAPDTQTNVSGSSRGELWFPPTRFRLLGLWLLGASFGLLNVSTANAQTAPGTSIENTAAVAYQNLAGVQRVADSNTIAIVVAQARTPSQTEFIRLLPGGTAAESLGPAACLANGQVIDLGAPAGPDGALLTPGDAYPVTATGLYSLTETVFIRVTDLDQNLDPNTAEVVIVTITSGSGDQETIELTETGLATGVFTGFVPLSAGAPQSGNCTLDSGVNDAISVDYVDSADANDTSIANANINPINIVFNSTTGELVDGVNLTLVDAVTGLPAVVLGYDGVSSYPATVRSGETATDDSGLRYEFPNGGFLFPQVAPGQYRLIAEPVGSFLAPSIRSIAELNGLPGGPFELSDGSFALAFTVAADGQVRFDVPIDPFSGGLFLTKTTTSQVAAPGDFVQYRLRLENTSDLSPAADVVVSDQLPLGFRLIEDSVRVEGQTTPDIALTANGFDIRVGTLAPESAIDIDYVVQVTGGARGEQATNIAVAASNRGVVSNEAQAAIRLADDFHRDRATLIGRVVEGDCSLTGVDDNAGIEGVRIYLEDGRYVVTDQAGRYHFEDIRPGVHVVQMDDETIPAHLQLQPCDENNLAAGSSRSRFVEARGGALHRADFALLRREAPVGSFDLELTNSGGSDANTVDYTLNVGGRGNVEVADLAVTVILPDGISLKRGTARSATGGEPKFTQTGPAVIFRLGDKRGDWQETLTFSGRIRPSLEGALETRAVAAFKTGGKAANRTPMATATMKRSAATTATADYVLSLNFATLSAELSSADQRELDALVAAWQDIDEISLSSVGHSDNVPIAARNRQIVADNYVLSEARARSVANYLATRLKIQDGDIRIDGRGPDRPVADNATPEGRLKNRRVELMLSGTRAASQSYLEVAKASSGALIAPTTGKIPGPETDELDAIAGPASMESILAAARSRAPAPDSLTPGAGWVLPRADARPAIPSIRIAVKHEPGHKVALSVNGEPAPGLSLEGVEVGRLSKMALTKWRAIRLRDGSNHLVAEITDQTGAVVERLEREISFAGGPIRGEIVAEESRLTADGRRRPIIAIRMFDGEGNLARTGAVGAFSVDSPYRSWWEVETSRENNLVTIGEREPLYRVENDGVARLELEPTTQSGEVVIRLKLENQREQELRVWLTPSNRDWILVGLAHGTVGYNTISENVARAGEAGIDEDYYDDGRVAFFAKGQIKGEYLLTLAYDTRGYAENFDRFDNVIDPNAFYTLYGDGAESRFEAASQRKLYVKLERQQFSALFGDYDTGLSVAELARYERRFNGLQLAYQGRNLGISAFASEAMQSFQRDEFQGNGTSGLYRLSQQQIVPQSEVVRLEVRDRLDASEVTTTTTLSRFVDYDIDYLNGTLLFKRPIASRDERFNPQFIVTEYETRAVSAEDENIGGRVYVGTADKRIEVGATYISEAEANGRGTLRGVDARVELGAATTLRAEYADSENNIELIEARGHAYRVEVEHRSGRFDVTAYHGKTDENFGLGQQSVSETGIMKSGLNGRMNVSRQTFIEAEVVKQENLDTGVEREIANASINSQVGGLSANVGLLHARDEAPGNVVRESNLATVGLSQALFDGRFAARLSGEMPLDSEDAVSDFPTRILAGFDWNIGRVTTAFVEHEITDGRDIESQMTRVGLRAQPWQRAQFDTSLTQEMTEFGPRLFANVGAVQGWQISDRWSVDFGVDHANTLTSPDIVVLDPNRPLVSGTTSDDFVATYAGAAYNAGAWSGNARLEFRNSESSESTSLLGGWYREPQAGHGFSAGFEWFDTESTTGETETKANLRMGWAYRPGGSQWAFLNRADFIVEERQLTTLTTDSWRVINNFNANRRLGAGSELSLKYGAKYVRADFDEQGFSGFTDLFGVEWRRMLSPRWDIGAHADAYHSWDVDIWDYSVGIDVGFELAKNMRVVVGYNFTGFEDRDFSAASYTASGPFIRFALKADQDTLARIAGRRPK